MSSAMTTEQHRAKERAQEVDRSIAFGERGAEVTTWEQANRFAVWAIESGLAKGMKKPSEVMMAVQMGAELGFSLMQSLQVIHVIEGRPSLSVEAQAAKVEADGVLEPGTKVYHRFEGEGENLACIAWSTPRGGERIESEPVYLHEFKHLRNRDNWKNYPKRMLKARAVGWHVRDYYAASVRNLPTAEEMRDLRSMRGQSPTPERDVTPPKDPDPLLSTPAPQPEPEDAQVVEPPCEHPDGFAAASDSEEPFCIHCGAVQEGTQEDLL